MVPQLIASTTALRTFCTIPRPLPCFFLVRSRPALESSYGISSSCRLQSIALSRPGNGVQRRKPSFDQDNGKTEANRCLGRIGDEKAVFNQTGEGSARRSFSEPRY